MPKIMVKVPQVRPSTVRRIAAVKVGKGDTVGLGLWPDPQGLHWVPPGLLPGPLRAGSI